jgi:predicted DNA-binding transcriptional regulator AlpA
VPQDDDLLTIKQAAARIGMSPKWLYRNYRNFAFVPMGDGKRPRIRFRVRDLDNWVSTHTSDMRRKYARARKH